MFPAANISPIELYDLIFQNGLGDMFPNIMIAYRIFLSIPIANFEPERGFSKLALIKNKLRATMEQERISALALLSIESEVTSYLDFQDVIENFARTKVRKINF